MNLGLRSNDDVAAVRRNRAIVASHLPSEPFWLDQVHGRDVVDADGSPERDRAPCADASWTTRSGRVLSILVADCLPVLFTDRRGTRVAAAHAGWRGLVAGVLEATMAASALDPSQTLAWMGPAIGPTRFEVGDDVRDAFLEASGSATHATGGCFSEVGRGKWLADLPSLARIRLAGCGVASVSDSGLCTASDPRRFYSYRRDGITGRMAAMIWIDH